jgi:5-formyltetrahydrofolate cyclo-ligase
MLGSGPLQSPADIRFVVVPIIAFDRKEHRLGSGRGRHPHTKKIGIAFSAWKCPEIPLE